MTYLRTKQTSIIRCSMDTQHCMPTSSLDHNGDRILCRCTRLSTMVQHQPLHGAWCSMVHGVRCIQYGAPGTADVHPLSSVSISGSGGVTPRSIGYAGRVCRGKPWTIRYAGLTYNRGCSSLTLECLLKTLCKINSILVLV